MRDAPGQPDRRAALERRPEWPVADERERPLTALLERAGEPEDVLPLRERPEAEERSALTVPAEVGACSCGVLRGEALEVDARAHDVRLAACLRDRILELRAQPLGDGDHPCRATDDVLRRAFDSGDRADVAHVLTVGGDDERRARGECADETGGDEEVRVDDVRMRPPGRAKRLAQEPRVP